MQTKTFIKDPDSILDWDFNWNVTSSNQTTKEFGIIKEKIENALDKNNYVYDYLKDEKELKFFIKNNEFRILKFNNVGGRKHDFGSLPLHGIS